MKVYKFHTWIWEGTGTYSGKIVQYHTKETHARIFP